MNTPAPIERRMFQRKPAADYLGIGLRSLDELAAAGDIPKTKIAGRVLYDRVDLDAFIERQKRTS